MKVFLDTNVVVDFCMRREPFFHDAAVIFDLIVTRNKKGFGDLNMVVQTPAEFIRECIG